MKQAKPLNKFGIWLVGKIDATNLSISEFALKAKVSRTGLHYLMRGERTPDLKTLTAICKALGVSVDETKQVVTPGKVGRPKGSKNRKSRNGTGVEQSTDVVATTDL